MTVEIYPVSNKGPLRRVCAILDHGWLNSLKPKLEDELSFHIQGGGQEELASLHRGVELHFAVIAPQKL